jgi:hypothetical protein
VEQEILVMLQPNATWAKFKHQLYTINNTNNFQQESANNKIEIKKVISEYQKIALLQLPIGIDKNEAKTQLNQFIL